MNAFFFINGKKKSLKYISDLVLFFYFHLSERVESVLLLKYFFTRVSILLLKHRMWIPLLSEVNTGQTQSCSTGSAWKEHQRWLFKQNFHQVPIGSDFEADWALHNRPTWVFSGYKNRKRLLKAAIYHRRRPGGNKGSNCKVCERHRGNFLAKGTSPETHLGGENSLLSHASGKMKQ